MKRTKVSLYVREPITRRYKLVTRNKDYPSTTTFVLRYGSAWETLKVDSVAAATAEKIQRELDLLKGWRPTAKTRTQSASKVKMLDAAMDEYLAEIQAGRKPKTYGAYRVALRYFYECVGNKALKDINRPDILDFPVFLREEKNQAPRSVYNKFENLMTFLKRHLNSHPRVDQDCSEDNQENGRSDDDNQTS